MEYTREQILKAKTELSRKLSIWRSYSEDGLNQLARQIAPFVRDATREECLHLLIMDLLDQHLPT
jgi:hypothetical protein